MTVNQPSSSPTRPATAPARKILWLVAAASLAILLAWILTSDTVQRRWWEHHSDAELEKTVSATTDSPWPYYTLGVRYARANRLQEAIQLFETARQKSPDSFDIRYALGKAYIFHNDPPNALSELEKAVTMRSNDAGVYTYLAMARRLTNNRESAREAAKKATELDPKKAEAWYQYGMLYSAQENNEDQGRPYLKKAVELDPSSSIYAFAYGSSLTNGSQFAEAIPPLRRATQALPNNSYGHFLLAVCLHRNGKSGNDLDEAVAELRRSIALTPNDYKAHFELGNVLEEQSKFAAALPEFEAATRLNPHMGEIWFHLSRVADRTGRTAEAAQARAKFTELRQLHVEFQTLVRRIQEHPEDSVAQLKIGQVMEKQGNVQGAAIQYADVLSREPQNAQAQKLLDKARLELSAQTGPPSPGSPKP